jgi:SAM-dependent methyltransferase
VIDDSLISFVLGSLPSSPARVLEVGAGNGELAARLRASGYDVVAIDPASNNPDVRAVPLHELDGEPGSFDAALAVVSLHHVEPLEESCRHLGTLVRPGGRLVIDELDMAQLDALAVRWFLDHRDHGHEVEAGPEQIVAEMQSHLHPLSRVLAALEDSFEFGATERGPYLYRWAQRPELRDDEERAIGEGQVPATGARVVGMRR